MERGRREVRSRMGHREGEDAAVARNWKGDHRDKLRPLAVRKIEEEASMEEGGG